MIIKTNPIKGNFLYRKYKNDAMKNRLSKARVYAYYYLGDLTSRLMYLPGFSILYNVYQWCMRRSIQIQDKTGCDGPWRSTDTKH